MITQAHQREFKLANVFALLIVDTGQILQKQKKSRVTNKKKKKYLND